MLTPAENTWNFKALKLYSLLNILPIKIQGKSGKIQKQPCKRRVFIWRFLFFTAILHLIYSLAVFIQSIVQPQDFGWDYTIVQFGHLLAYFSWYFTGYCLFVKNGSETVMIFNQLFVLHSDPTEASTTTGREENVSENQDEEKGPVPVSTPARERSIRETTTPVRPLFTWPIQYSLHELMAKLLCFALFETQAGAVLIYFVHPKLLLSFLPRDYQNWYTFFILLALQVFVVTFNIAVCLLSVLVQLEFFSKCQYEFEQLHLQLRHLVENFQHLLIRDLDREIKIIRKILSEMRELVLFIELFNRAFPFVIFSFKLYCLSSSIVFTVFTIRHFHEFPVLTVFFGPLGIALTILYSIMYQHAFSVPSKMEELKQEFLQVVQNSASASKSSLSKYSRRQNVWTEFQREIQGLRDVGIKVGRFHNMERESVPNFVDFVARQVVSLLVTFPG